MLYILSMESRTSSEAAWAAIEALRRLHHVVDIVMDRALEEMGISFSQLQVLESLRTGKARHASAIARALRVQRQSLRGPIRSLELSDLIERFDADGGVRVIAITPRGRRRHELAMGAIRMPLDYLRDAITDDDARQLIQLLEKLQRAYEARPRTIWWRPRDDLREALRPRGWNDF
jgi:DNA-binding MarR family transcriptional regulator